MDSYIRLDYFVWLRSDIVAAYMIFQSNIADISINEEQYYSYK